MRTLPLGHKSLRNAVDVPIRKSQLDPPKRSCKLIEGNERFMRGQAQFPRYARKRLLTWQKDSILMQRSSAAVTPEFHKMIFDADFGSCLSSALLAT